MAVDPEKQDTLKAVESILVNAQTEKTCVAVRLPIDTAVHVAVQLFLRIPFNFRVLHDDSYGAESMRLMSGLKEKFRPVVYEPVEGMDGVSIDLCAEEVDLLNRIHLDYIGLYRQAGREGWYPYQSESEERRMLESGAREWMADFVTLNRAFIEAGGRARPEFTRMCDGI